MVSRVRVDDFKDTGVHSSPLPLTRPLAHYHDKAWRGKRLSHRVSHELPHTLYCLSAINYDYEPLIHHDPVTESMNHSVTDSVSN